MKNNIYHLSTILFLVAFSKAAEEKYLLVEIADEDLANYVKNSKSLKEYPGVSQNMGMRAAWKAPEKSKNTRHTFLSNHNIHKSSCVLCFWAAGSLIDRFY